MQIPIVGLEKPRHSVSITSCFTANLCFVWRSSLPHFHSRLLCKTNSKKVVVKCVSSRTVFDQMDIKGDVETDEMLESLFSRVVCLGVKQSSEKKTPRCL